LFSSFYRKSLSSDSLFSNGLSELEWNVYLWIVRLIALDIEYIRFTVVQTRSNEAGIALVIFSRSQQTWRMRCNRFSRCWNITFKLFLLISVGAHPMSGGLQEELNDFFVKANQLVNPHYPW